MCTVVFSELYICIKTIMSFWFFVMLELHGYLYWCYHICVWTSVHVNIFRLIIFSWFISEQLVSWLKECWKYKEFKEAVNEYPCVCLNLYFTECRFPVVFFLFVFCLYFFEVYQIAGMKGLLTMNWKGIVMVPRARFLTWSEVCPFGPPCVSFPHPMAIGTACKDMAIIVEPWRTIYLPGRM